LYYDVDKTKDEIEFIDNFKNTWEQEQQKLPKEEVRDIPSFWTDGDYVRYANTNNFNANEMIKQVKLNTKWLEDLKNFDLSEEAANYLKNGNVYIGGRDNFGSPCLVFDTKGIKKLDKRLAKDL